MSGLLNNDQLSRLIGAAQAASTQAYAPYSRFRVGAALMTSDGTIFQGCNIENASYGLTICAERVAAFQGVSQGDRDWLGLVVYTPTDSPTMPCGACRQVLNEFSPDLEIICVADGPTMVRTTLTDLLPHAFGPANLDS